MKKRRTSAVSVGHKRRIRRAERDYRRMWEQIKPFVRERKIKECSTTGEWRISSHEW